MCGERKPSWPEGRSVGKQSERYRRALEIIESIADGALCTAAAHKAYDTRSFAVQMREINATPRVAQNIDHNWSSAIDGRSTRCPEYALRLTASKLRGAAFSLRQGYWVLPRPKLRRRATID
jgi:hypothetical protein